MMSAKKLDFMYDPFGPPHVKIQQKIHSTTTHSFELTPPSPVSVDVIYQSSLPKATSSYASLHITRTVYDPGRDLFTFAVFQLGGGMTRRDTPPLKHEDIRDYILSRA